MGALETTKARPAATARREPAVCYTVRNAWAWAHIFIRHGQANDRPSGDVRHWVHVSVLSDFGEFGYCWSHIGGDWRAFLSGLDFDYAMQKMLGSRFRVPLEVNEATEKARELVLQWRRGQSLTGKDARLLWDALADTYWANGRDSFLSDLDHASDGAMYRNEMWDCRWDQPCPQATGFWQEIWPHFIAGLQAEATPPATPAAAVLAGGAGLTPLSAPDEPEHSIKTGGQS